MIVTEHLFAIEDQTECLISALLESDAVQNYKEAKKSYVCFGGSCSVTKSIFRS